MACRYLVRLRIVRACTIVVVVLVALTIASTRAAAISPELQPLVHGNNQFAFDMYRGLAGGAEGENLFFSPFSVSTALAMTYAGARGQTAAEMAQTLHFPSLESDLHSGYGALLADLNAPERTEYELAVANRLWGQDGFGFHETFLDVTSQQYGAELGRVDFTTQTEAARNTINDWVAEQTNDRILDLLPRGSVTPDTRLVLTNAIYFLGDWQSPFDAEDTYEGRFRVTPEEQIDATMMHQTGSFRYAELPHAQVLEMPYQGDDVSMLLVLPDETTGLADAEDWLNADTLLDTVDALEMTRVDVKLPKFQMEMDASLKRPLVELGKPTAFSGSANFSGMADANLTISDVIHKAFLRVDEKGTEAAAATGVIIGLTSVPPPPSAYFHADHPFLLAMRDNRTESLLFLGRVMRPEAIEQDGTPRQSALAGDFDGDGVINQGDLDLVLLHWGNTFEPGSGINVASAIKVDQRALDAVLLHWGAAAPSPDSAAVPEPATWLLCALGVVWLAMRCDLRTRLFPAISCVAETSHVQP